MKITLISILLLFSFGISSAQSSFSARLLTVTSHPFAKQNLTLHKNPIDNNGYLTFEPGLILSYDKYLVNKFALRMSTSVMNDRYNTLAGYSQIMLKYKVLKYYKHSVYLGFGPAVHYSTNKMSIENYINEDNYKTANNTMYKIAWLSGMAEYNYYVSKKTDFVITLNHTDVKSLGISLGVRFDIPDPNGKGCDCPSFR